MPPGLLVQTLRRARSAPRQSANPNHPSFWVFLILGPDGQGKAKARVYSFMGPVKLNEPQASYIGALANWTATSCGLSPKTMTNGSSS